MKKRQTFAKAKANLVLAIVFVVLQFYCPSLLAKANSADINNDGFVNFKDCAIVANDWLKIDTNLPGDINGDEIVDPNDLYILGRNWLWIGIAEPTCGSAYSNDCGPVNRSDILSDAAHYKGGNDNVTWMGSESSTSDMHVYVYFNDKTIDETDESIELTLKYYTGNGPGGLNTSNTTANALRVGLMNNHGSTVGDNSGISNAAFANYTGYYIGYGVDSNNDPEIFQRNTPQDNLILGTNTSVDSGTQDDDMDDNEYRTLTFKVTKTGSGIAINSTHDPSGTFDFTVNDNTSPETTYNTIVIGIDDTPELMDWLYLEDIEVEHCEIIDPCEPGDPCEPCDPCGNTLTVNGGTGDGDYDPNTMVDISATVPEGDVFDRWRCGEGNIVDVYDPNTQIKMPANSITITATYRDESLTGIDEIDAIRADVIANPTTTTGNAASRRAALYRWWRFLWHQGYNTRTYDSTWNTLINYGDDTSTGRAAITTGYGHLEDLLSSGDKIAEVSGTPGTSPTETNWPTYHGTDGNQDGYSPDSGPSEGSIAWQAPIGHNWTAQPVIESGKVYIASPGVDVIGYCLNETTGAVEWNARTYGVQLYHSAGSILSPAVASDRVMFLVGWWQADDLYIADKTNGSIVDIVAAGSTSGGSTANLAVYKRNRWNFILADARTGSGIYQFSSGGTLAGEPILVGNKVYSARQSGRVYRHGTGSSTPEWDRDLSTALRGTVSMYNGTVYVGSKGGKLFALYESNGNTKWSYQATETENKAYVFYSSAIEANGKVYVGAASKYVYCLDASTGNLNWKYQVSDWVRSKPLVIGSNVYVATLDGKIYKLQDNGGSAGLIWSRQIEQHGFIADLVGNSNGILASSRNPVLYSISPETGYVQWRHGIIDAAWVDGVKHLADVRGGQFQSSPTVNDDIVYTGGPDGFVRALNVDNGNEIWKFEAGGRVSATPIYAEDKVFFGKNAHNNEYYAVDALTGEPEWVNTDFGWVFIGAAYANSKIYVADISGKMRALNPSTGATLWTYDTGSGMYPNPASDSTKVYSGSHNGYYYAFNQTDGSVAWSTLTGTGGSGGNPDSAAPAIYGSYLYVQKLGHEIAALSLATGDIEWIWTVPGGFLQNGAVAARDNRIFGSAVRLVVEIPYNATIYALDAGDGDELWSHRGGGGLTAPVVTDNKLVFGSSADVFVSCVNPTNGNLIWRCYVGGAMEEAVPALYGNKVFLTCRNGYLFAIE